MSRLYANAWVVTCDDAGTEHVSGWLLVEDDVVSAVGGGAEPPADERMDLGGAVVTPGLVNTHHHLYQTLTRARAQEANLFGWLRELYPVWAGIDAEAEYAAARAGLAELALSGCTTVFDHHYVFPRGREGLVEAEVRAARELGVRIVASRGSMDLGASDGGLPPDELVEEIDAVLAETERLAGSLHEPGRGAQRADRGRSLLPVFRDEAPHERICRARAAARPEAPHPRPVRQRTRHAVRPPAGLWPAAFAWPAAVRASAQGIHPAPRYARGRSPGVDGRPLAVPARNGAARAPRSQPPRTPEGGDRRLGGSRRDAP